MGKIDELARKISIRLGPILQLQKLKKCHVSQTRVKPKLLRNIGFCCALICIASYCFFVLMNWFFINENCHVGHTKLGMTDMKKLFCIFQQQCSSRQSGKSSCDGFSRCRRDNLLSTFPSVLETKSILALFNCRNIFFFASQTPLRVVFVLFLCFQLLWHCF